MSALVLALLGSLVSALVLASLGSLVSALVLALLGSLVSALVLALLGSLVSALVQASLGSLVSALVLVSVYLVVCILWKLIVLQNSILRSTLLFSFNHPLHHHTAYYSMLTPTWQDLKHTGNTSHGLKLNRHHVK